MALFGSSYTNDWASQSSSSFYGVRRSDEEEDSSSSLDTGSSHDEGEIDIGVSVGAPSPALDLPYFHGRLRAYLKAVDGFFAGYGGPHAPADRPKVPPSAAAIPTPALRWPT